MAHEQTVSTTDARIRRRSEGDVYHVIVRGAGRMLLFEDDEDRLCYLNMLAAALRQSQAEVWAWCLMSNHVHLLLKVDFDDLPRLMQRLSGGYAGYYNKRHEHVGHVFAGRYKSVPVAGDDQLIAAVRYIHGNPLKEKLSDTYEYRWSSYNDYLHLSGITSTGFVLDVCGGLGRFVEIHDGGRKAAVAQEGADGQAAAVEAMERAAAEMVLESSKRRHNDEEALAIAKQVLRDERLSDIASMGREQRNARIAILRRAGLSAKQVERFTGIGRGIVERVKWRD